MVIGNMKVTKEEKEVATKLREEWNKMEPLSAEEYEKKMKIKEEEIKERYNEEVK